MGFYDAGQCSRQEKDLSMAFVFLNRYLDITEAMEENEANAAALDNSDFVETGIPTDFPLSDKDREKVRDYVLELSMNANVQQTLNTSEMEAIFKEGDQVKDAVLRGGRSSGSEFYQILRDTVAQVP